MAQQTLVLRVPPREQSALRERLARGSFEFRSVPHAIFSVKGEGIVLNEPSVVAIEKSNGKLVGVGLSAKGMLGRTPGGIEAIRPLKDGVIADVDISELMLRHFLKTVTAKRVFRLKPRVVIGVPSGITELERRAVRAGAQAARADWPA